MRRRVLAMVVLAALGVGPGVIADAGARQCRDVAYMVVADAAPIAARLDQGTAVPVPVAYSHVEHETAPQYVYAEAGSTALGPLEGVVLQPRQLTGLIGGMFPVELPDIPDIPGAPAVPVPPGRAASTFPESSLPPVATGDWAVGRSHTEASAIRAHARSGIDTLGLRSSITSTIDCETLVVEAAWSLVELTLPGGITLGRIGQTVRVEMSADGEPEVDVDTVVLDENLGLGGLFGELPDDIVAEIFAAGGQEFAVGDPEVIVTDDDVTVTASPVAMRFAPPGGTQAVGVTVGLIDVSVQRLGVIPPATTQVPSSPVPQVVPEPSSHPPLPTDPPSLSPPAPTEATTAPVLAVETVSSQSSPLDYFSTRGHRWWQPLLAGVLVAAVFSGVAAARRDRWPTADWTLARLEAAGRWFHTTYLRW